MWDAISRWVAAFVTAIAAFYSGTIKRENDQHEADLHALEASAKAAAGVDLLSDDDVVRQLHERRLYRLRGEPADDK